MEAIQTINDFKTQKNHINDLYNTVENRVDNAFDLTHLLQNKTMTKLVVYFDKFPAKLRKGIKYWIEDELLIKNTSPGSARGLTLSIGSAISYLQTSCGPIDSPEDIQEEQFDSYMMHLEDRVRNQVTLELKSAYSYAISFMKLLNFLHNEDIVKYPYLSKKKISKLFPFEYPEKFFSGDALKEHLSIKQKKKDSRPLDYFHLIEVLENIQGYDDVLFSNISIIMAHTGLRLTEVLHLETNCLENVTKEEEKAAENNRIPIDEKEDLYWLSNYKTIKGKQKKWVQGTPILVGSEVKEAVDLLAAHSRDLLQKHEKALEGSTSRICLIFYHGSVKIITSSGYDSKRKTFISNTGIKYFTAHQFRHTYASMLYDSGVPIEYIRKYLNHIHEDMTGGYIKKDKQRSMQKYESFASAKVFAGGGSKKAHDFQDKIKEAFEHPEFGAMAIEERTQFLEMLSDSMDMDIHAMDHGMCLIPKGTACPNNFMEINSCFEQNCGQFATTETSIPHFTRIVKYKEGWIKDFENTGHLAAAEKGKANLAKSIDILEKLKKGEYFDE